MPSVFFRTTRVMLLFVTIRGATLVAARRIQAGEEVTNCYTAPLSNAQMLLGWGFTIPAKTGDWLMAVQQAHHLVPLLDWNVAVAAAAALITRRRQQQQHCQVQPPSNDSTANCCCTNNNIDHYQQRLQATAGNLPLELPKNCFAQYDSHHDAGSAVGAVAYAAAAAAAAAPGSLSASQSRQQQRASSQFKPYLETLQQEKQEACFARDLDNLLSQHRQQGDQASCSVDVAEASSAGLLFRDCTEMNGFHTSADRPQAAGSDLNQHKLPEPERPSTAGPETSMAAAPPVAPAASLPAAAARLREGSRQHLRRQQQTWVAAALRMAFLGQLASCSNTIQQDQQLLQVLRGGGSSSHTSSKEWQCSGAAPGEVVPMVQHYQQFEDLQYEFEELQQRVMQQLTVLRALHSVNSTCAASAAAGSRVLMAMWGHHQVLQELHDLKLLGGSDGSDGTAAPMSRRQLAAAQRYLGGQICNAQKQQQGVLQQMLAVLMGCEAHERWSVPATSSSSSNAAACKIVLDMSAAACMVHGVRSNSVVKSLPRFRAAVEARLEQKLLLSAGVDLCEEMLLRLAS
jgi:hypothetical protein